MADDGTIEVHLSEEDKLYLEVTARRSGNSKSGILRGLIRGFGPVVTWSEFISHSPAYWREEIRKYESGNHPEKDVSPPTPIVSPVTAAGPVRKNGN